jgi:NADH dehydrogenase
MAERLITVFGGSGFLGRHLVKRLAARGWRVRVAVRDPEGANFLKPMGEVGQIAPVQANLRDEGSVARAVANADAVVNLVGILYESGHQRFDAVHAAGAGRVARAAAAADVTRLVQVSAIGADAGSPSLYARSKAAGEEAARSAFPDVTIFRPSLVFGPEDQVFNRFAALARLSPVLPLIGGGDTRFQPVYVGDVAEAMARALDDPATKAKTYELGGPEILTFRQLMEVVMRETGRRRLLVPWPTELAMFQALFLELLPVPPLTRDQVKLLQRDNVVGTEALTLADLGVTATAVDAVVPSYLARFRRHGGYGEAITE